MIETRLKNHYIAFTAPHRAELLEEEISTSNLKPGQAIVAAEYSIISAGTEGADFSDLVRQMPGFENFGVEYPRRSGYGHLGRVIAKEPDTEQVQVGDRVLTFSSHSARAIADVARFALIVPEQADGRLAVATRMAGVSITALRTSSVQPGDRVVVIGLGLVGNFAAQMFQLAGARVLGLDVDPQRLAIARTCGIAEVLNASTRNPVQSVRDWSGDGNGAEIVVEAIGRSELILQAVEMTRRCGETILLGSPRARVTADITPMLLRVHLEGIRMIGALEWRYPIADKAERARFTIEGNYKQILDWIMRGRLIIDPLISHVLSPRQCQDAYSGLANRRSEYTAVVFDWSEFADDPKAPNKMLG